MLELTLTSAGTGYTVGDTLTLAGTSGSAVITLTAVGASDGVFAWDVTSNTLSITETGIDATGGSGSGAVFSASINNWVALTTDDILSEFTVPENSSIRNLLGGTGSGSASGSGSGPPFWNLDLVTVRVIDEVRGYIAAGGYSLDETSDPRTIPLELFEDAIAIARWRILISVPMLKQLQTEERKLAFDAAIKKLTLIAEQKFFVVPPAPDITPRGGNWNSENKLIMRTHPIPRPGSQFTPQVSTYANPSPPAPEDTEQAP